MMTALLFVAIVCCLSSLTVAQQVGCSDPPSRTQVVSLIASNYGTDQSGNRPTITLQTSPFGFEGYRVVCSSSSGIRNQYRFVSIVAYFTTSDSNVSPLEVPIYVQFEFECVSSIWTTTSNLLGAATTNRLPLSSDSAAINATSKTDCAYCLRPTSSLRMSDSINHCCACTGCSQPLCTITDTTIPSSASFTQLCCNYYSSDGVTCIAGCSPPPSYFFDANRTCTQCTLTCQNGGTRRNDVCGCNCTAVSMGSDCSTCLCQNGGTCNANGTCSCPPGYSGQFCDTSTCTLTLTCPAENYLNSITCSCVSCPASCTSCSDSNTCTACKTGFDLTLEKHCASCPANCTSCSDSNTCTICNTGFMLNSEKHCDPKCSDYCNSCTVPYSCTICNPGYSLNAGGTCVPKTASGEAKKGGCDGGCIGGIIGGILGALMLAGIIAAVVAVVYFVMNNPATATSAVPGAGLNGVAKDNPLYLDPKVVEDTVASAQ